MASIESSLRRLRKEAEVTYGPEIGPNLINYAFETYIVDQMDYEKAKQYDPRATRLAFLESVLNAFENGTHEERLSALNATFVAIEKRIVQAEYRSSSRIADADIVVG